VVVSATCDLTAKKVVLAKKIDAKGKTVYSCTCTGIPDNGNELNCTINFWYCPV